jgi:hypothetical protein
MTHTGFHRVLNVINAYGKHQLMMHIMGAPRKVTDEMKDFIVERSAQNGGISSGVIAKMVADERGVITTPQTVRNVLHEFSFKWAPAKKCPQLTPTECALGYNLDSNSMAKCLHTTPDNITKLTRRCILCPIWPPNSPDLNPIEMLWNIIKQKLQWSTITTSDEAIAKIKEIWNHLEMRIINGLCASFVSRVEMMQQAGGKTIQPLLSAHRTTVPEGYLQNTQHIVLPCPWNREQDDLLIAMKNDGLKSWSALSGLFPWRFAASVRNRWQTLTIARRTVLNGAL